jgi:outer membrane protein
MTPRAAALLLTCCALAFAAPSGAADGAPDDDAARAEADDDAGDTPRWTIGAMAIHRDPPYRGYDEGLWAVPLLRFEGERAYIRGLRGGVRLVERDGFEFGPVAQLRFDGYDAGESDFLAGMDDREFSIDGGLAAAYRNDRVGQFDLSVVTDLLDRSGGTEVELGYTALFRAAGFTFIPNLALKWQDDELVDYYYGVRDDEALPGRPAYRGDAALVPELSVTAMRPLSPRWTLYARVGHAWLPSEITDSPIVDDDARTTFAVGVGYGFD